MDIFLLECSPFVEKMSGCTFQGEPLKLSNVGRAMSLPLCSALLIYHNTKRLYGHDAGICRAYEELMNAYDFEPNTSHFDRTDCIYQWLTYIMSIRSNRLNTIVNQCSALGIVHSAVVYINEIYYFEFLPLDKQTHVKSDVSRDIISGYLEMKRRYDAKISNRA